MPIHPTAVVDSGAEIGRDVEIGPFAVVGPGVVLGDATVLMAHAVVLGPSEIGAACRVFPHAVLGAEAQDSRSHDEQPRLVVGPGCIFREGSTAHRGTSRGRGETRIGARGFFLANSHVAHDCLVGDDVVFANSAAIAGHVEIGSQAVLGGLVGVHQHARVGRLAMVGAGSMVSQDIAPFMLAQGDRARILGPNLVGLRRAGFDASRLEAIRNAFRALFSGGGSLSEAVTSCRLATWVSPDVEEILRFIESSRRGFARADRSLPES